MINPADLARPAATLIVLPNTASVAELLVNCQLVDTLQCTQQEAHAK